VKRFDNSKVYLGKVGDFWDDPGTELLLIPDESEMIEIHVVSVDGKHKKIIPVSLDFLPKRPVKTRRICFKTNSSGFYRSLR